LNVGRPLAGLWLGAALLVSCRTTAPATTAPTPPAAPATVSAAPAAPAPDDDLGGPAGKRVGPPDVPPVQIGSLILRAIPWGRERGLPHNGGYIGAYDAATGQEAWTLEVYPVVYDPKLEEDVQDIFIEKLLPGPGPHDLTVVDERARRHIVDTVTRKVR
jgi:hypothetical protein